MASDSESNGVFSMWTRLQFDPKRIHPKLFSIIRIEWRNMWHTILIKLICAGIYSPTRNEWPIINSIVNFIKKIEMMCDNRTNSMGKQIEETDWIDFIINFERWDRLEYLQSSNRNNNEREQRKKKPKNEERRRRPNIGAHLNLLWWHTTMADTMVYIQNKRRHVITHDEIVPLEKTGPFIPTEPKRHIHTIALVHTHMQ